MTHPAAVRRLRDELAALDRAYSRGGHGRWSARRRAELVDACVVQLFRDAAVDSAGRLALVALGGYGRGELAPFSDVDLLVLHASRDHAAATSVAERVFYPLWDAGLTVGNAVRTARETLTLARQHLDAWTAALDARLLAGDEDLFASFRERVLATAREDAAKFITRLQEAAAERRAKFGSVSHLLEPDLKEGAGGLRDVHTLGWIAAAVGDPDLRGLRALEAADLLSAPERRLVDGAEEYLTRLRSALHLEVGKKLDRVHLELQRPLAAELGFGDEPGLPAEDALMRATFEHGRAVEHVLSAVLARALAPRVTVRGVDPGTSAHSVLEVFRAAAVGDGTVPPDLLERIDPGDLPEEVTWDERLREAFLDILRRGDAGAAVLEAMDRAGLLVRFLPEWAAVRCRPQRDPYHRFTVDVHLLETLSRVARFVDDPPADDPVALKAAAALTDRDGLLVGALLHDIGKTGERGHVAIGARVAARTLDRIGLPEPSRSLVQFLVTEHLLLADTATRRDLQDENLVVEVAARVGDPERLAALYLLTIADAAATGPHAWTPWRATLVRELVTKVQHVLERGEIGTDTAERLATKEAAIRSLLEDRSAEEIEAFLARLPRAYLLAVSPEEAARSERLLERELGTVEVRTAHRPGSRAGTYSLTVVARDRPGLLSRIAGALALTGLSVLSAQVFTTEDGVAIDLFDVEPAFHGEVDEERWRAFRSTLRRSVEGRLSLEYRVREKRAYYPRKSHARVPVRVSVDNAASDFFTVIEVGAPDRIGLLFDITRTLADLQLDVHVAKVATYGERVVDAFYVRDVVGQKVEDDEHVREIERAITAALAD